MQVYVSSLGLDTESLRGLDWASAATSGEKNRKNDLPPGVIRQFLPYSSKIRHTQGASLATSQFRVDMVTFNGSKGRKNGYFSGRTPPPTGEAGPTESLFPAAR